MVPHRKAQAPDSRPAGDTQRPASLAAALHALAEREKELHCSYAITRTLVDETLPVDLALERIATFVANAMKFPEAAEARITYGSLVAQTKGFTPGSGSLEEPIQQLGEERGRIEVTYTDPPVVTEPFLGEERQMIASVAEILGYALWQRPDESAPVRLSRRARQLESIIDKSPSIAFVWQLTEGWPVEFVSESVRQLGYAPKEFYAGTITYTDLVHPGDLERVTTEVTDYIDRAIDDFYKRYRVRTRSGETRWIGDWTHLLRDAAGHAERAQGIVLDISEQVEAEERARRYLKGAGSAFVGLDTDGRVLAVNDKLMEFTGASETELLGCDWIARFVPEEERAGARRELERLVSGQGGASVSEHDNDIVSTTGHRRTIHWHNTVECDENGRITAVLAFGADVTRQRTSERLAEDMVRFPRENPNPVLRVDRNGDVLTANPAAQVLISSIGEADPGEYASWVVLIEHARQVRERETCELKVNNKVYLVHLVSDSSSDQVNLYGADITEQREYETRMADVAKDIPGVLCQYVVHADGTESIPYASPGFAAFWGLPDGPGPVDPAQLWAAMNPDDLPAVERSIRESSRSLSDWLAEWRIMCPDWEAPRWVKGHGTARRLGDGAVNFNCLLLDVTDERKTKTALAASLRQTVDVLASATEVRDPYTAGHQRRVAWICKIIGARMGLDKQRLEGLELAATIHDIGKIRVPAEILSKPAGLTKSEYEIVKEHSQVGADIISGIDFEWPIAEMILQHHERLDGSGYPRGLAGDDIILEARILGVADTLEAMASHRPYRPGFGLTAAAQEISSNAGVLFDADVAGVCLELVESGEIVL